MNQTDEIMDRGPKVELISHTTEPITTIWLAYRRCYSSESVHRGVDTVQQEQFIRNMMKTGHDSPLEHVSFTFSISGVSRSLTHQLVRHRIASFSQMSQRYVDSGDAEFIIPKRIREDPVSKEIFDAFNLHVMDIYAELRDRQLELGRTKEEARETARCVLPQSTETKLIVTMNCRALLNFFSLRCCTRAQDEIRHLANKMLKICRYELPCVFGHAGAKCEKMKLCPESPKFSCGKYPTIEK